MSGPEASLDRSLGHAFADHGLLATALTHRSLGCPNNERLEFLGDAILGFVISEQLYRAFPSLDEGRLSRLRASLVKGETLAELARELDLGSHVRLGPGELKSGGFNRDSILADTLEAIVAAIYLDAGLDRARDFILGLFRQRLAALDPEKSCKDPKTRLQEWLQARKLDLPGYRLVEVTGKEHDQHFTVECRVDALDMAALSNASSRRKAEQGAAAAVLEKLGE